MLPEANRKSLGKIEMPQLPVFNPETNLIRIGHKPNGFFNIDTGRYISVNKDKLENQLNGSEARHFDFQTDLGNMNLCAFELFKGKEKVRWQSETLFSHELLHFQPTLIDNDGKAYCYAALDISKGMLSISLDADWELRANLGHGRFASGYGIHSYAVDLMSIQALFNSTQTSGKKPFALSMGLSANGPSFGSSAKLQNFGDVEFSVSAVSVSASLGSEISWERGFNASMSGTLGVTGPTASVGYKPVYELCFLGLTVNAEVNLTVGSGHKIEVGTGVTFDKTRPQLRLYTKLGLFSGTGAAVNADWNLGFDSNFATRVQQDIQASIESWKEDSFFKSQFEQLEKMQREAKGDFAALAMIQEMQSELYEQLAYFATPRAIWSVITNAFSIREIETIPVEVENAAGLYDNQLSVIQQLAQELAPQIFGASFIYPTQSDFTTLSFLTLSDTAEQRCAKFDEKFLQDVFKQGSLSTIPIVLPIEAVDKEDQASAKTNPSGGSRILQIDQHNLIYNVPREQRLNLEFNLLDSQSLLSGSYGRETGFSGNVSSDDLTARLSLFKITSGGMAFAPTLSLAIPLELTTLSLGIIGGAALGVGALAYVGKRIYERQQNKKLPAQTKNQNEITGNIIKLQDAINERTFNLWVGWKYSEIQNHFSEKLKDLLDAKISYNHDNLDTVYYAAAQKYAIEQKRHDLVRKWSSNQGYVDKETIDFFQHYLETSASQFEKAIHTNKLSDARHIVGDLQSKLPESFLSKYYDAVLCAVENPSQGLVQLKQAERYARFSEEKSALKSAEFSLTWSKALENPTQHNINEVKQFALKNISDMQDNFVSSYLYDFKNQKPYEDKNQIVKSYTEIEKKVILSDDHKRCYARSLYHCAVHEVNDQVLFYKKTISVLCSLSLPDMDDRILKCLAQIAVGEENSFLEIKTELQAIRQQLKTKGEQPEIANDQKRLLENVSIGLANLALAERNIPQAINELTECESTNGITPLTSRFLADLLFSNQEFSRSIAYFEAVPDFKNDQRLCLSYLLALIESDGANFNSKNRIEIIDKFTQLSNGLEEMGENFNSLKAYLACAGSHLAIIAAEQGDFELAKQVIQKMQQYPGGFNEEYSFQLAGLALSCMKMAKEQSSDANTFLKLVLENCNAVLQVKSTDVTAKLIKAHAHFAANDYSAADQLSEEIIQQIDQRITQTNSNCIEILEADLHTAAKACMLRANIALQSNKTQQEKMKQGIKYSKEALKFNPREIEARKQLGDLARARGQTAQATKYYNECLSQEPTYLPAMQQLILIQTTEGEFSNARDELGKNKQMFKILNKGTEPLERLEEGIDRFEHRISTLSWTRLGIFAGNWLLKQGLNHDSSKKYFGEHVINSVRCISGGVEWLASPIGQYLQHEYHADLERSAGNEPGENKVSQNTLHDPKFWLQGYNIAVQVMIQNKWIDRDGDFKTAIDLGEMGQQVLSLSSDINDMASVFCDTLGEDGDITDYSAALAPAMKQLFRSIKSVCKDSLKANGQMMHESKWIYMMTGCAQVALSGLALRGMMTLCLDKAVMAKLITTVKTVLSSYSSALMALNPWAIAGGIALCVMGCVAYHYYVKPHLEAEVREAKIHNASVLLKEAQELKSQANQLKKENETAETQDLIQQAEDKIKLAKQKYQEVLAEQSDHQVAKQALKKLEHDARLQVGEYAIVIEECNTYLNHPPSAKIPTDDDMRNQWYYLLLRGRAYFQNGNLHLAENDFSNLLAMDKTHIAMSNLQKWINGDKSISGKPEFDTLQDAISVNRYLSHAKLRRSQYAAAKEHCDATINLIKNLVLGNQRILSEALGKQWKLGGAADSLYEKVKEHRTIASVVGINDENFRMHVIAEKANSQIVNLEEELEDVQKYYASIEDVLQKAWDGTAGNIAASIINKLSSSMSSVLHDYRELNSQPVAISRWRPSLFHQPSCDDPSKEETLRLLRCLQVEPQEKEIAPEKFADILYSKTNLRFN